MARLPKSLTRVTAFSKVLALLLILAFLGVAFYAGTLFDQKYVSQLATISPTPTPIVSEQNSCQQDSDCILTDLSEQGLCCPNTKCIDYSKESEQAVSSNWLQNHKLQECGGKMCIMIAAVCTKNITEENAHYSAKCLSHTCMKVRS